MDEQEDPEFAELTPAEARVLGCLLEKEMATPDNYPLTLNSLQSACNQQSSREPVMALESDEIEDAIEGLRIQKLAAHISMAGSRVPKFKHTLDREFGALERRHLGLLAVLLLRGRQTVAELRTRSARLYHFADAAATEEALDELAAYEKRPLAKRLPSGGGYRMVTYVPLLCAAAPPEAPVVASEALPAEAPASGWRVQMDDRIVALESEVAELRQTIAELKEALGE